jgi:hypothetical protein
MAASFFKEAKILFDSGLHRQREVVINATLRNEPYVIVPYTAKPNVEGKFLIRYWSPSHMLVKRLGSSSQTAVNQERGSSVNLSVKNNQVLGAPVATESPAAQ